MARPVIALLTDFGLSDHYVAAMKGVMLGICPDATLLDITHDIPPQDILSGALQLESVGPYLPPNTIVVGVVDPGVGSLRRAVAFDTRDGLRCVGPDNGLFSLLAEVSGVGTAVEITNPAYMRVPLSKTFEGRDRFAPAAAWLARGVELLALGPMAGRIAALDVPAPTRTTSVIEGQVLRTDRFGNLLTNIRGAWLDVWGMQAAVAVNDVEVGHVITTYADAAPGSLCALVGSSGRLEIAVNGGHAGSRLGIGRGARVQVRRVTAA